MQKDIKERLYYYKRFLDWEKAVSYCKSKNGGYSSDHILEAVVNATNDVIEGKALYEQDGVSYKKEHNNYELLFALFYIYSKEKRLRVCDYGGALGSTYRRYKRHLPKDTEWCVVEQKNYVEYGKKYIDELLFFYNIQECIEEREIDVVLLSGSLQYLDYPYKVLTQLSEYAKYFIIDETSFHKNSSEDIYIQHTPALYYGKETYYPVNLFDRNKYIDFMQGLGYKKEFEWLYEGCGIGIPVLKNKNFIDTIDRGFLWVKQHN